MIYHWYIQTDWSQPPSPPCAQKFALRTEVPLQPHLSGSPCSVKAVALASAGHNAQGSCWWAPHSFGSILRPFPMSFYTDIYMNYCFRELHSCSGPSTSETGTWSSLIRSQPFPAVPASRDTRRPQSRAGHCNTNGERQHPSPTHSPCSASLCCPYAPQS